MSFRVDVTESGTIEIQRYDAGRWHHTPFRTLEGALIVIRYLIKLDMARTKEERFEPQFIREARKAFNILNERSPYNGKREKR